MKRLDRGGSFGPAAGVFSAAVAAVAMLSTAGSVSAQASPPPKWNFQGRLTDATGTPINTAQNMIFRFFDASASGTNLLSESQAGVPVNAGIYNVTFNSGTVTPGSEASYAAMFSNQSAVWLEVEVATEVMSPRIRIVSAPYATNAAALDGLPASAFLLASGTAANGPFSISESAASPSLLVNDTGGGPLLLLQNTGVDKFVVNPIGDVSASGFLNLGGLAADPASPTAGDGRFYFNSSSGQFWVWNGPTTSYLPVAAGYFVHLGQGVETDGSPSPSIFINKVASGTNILELQRNGADRFVIDNAGSVGIGVPAPGSRLEVKGPGAGSGTSALSVLNGAGSSLLFARDDGYVGIGTSGPAVRLHVQEAAPVIRLQSTAAQPAAASQIAFGSTEAGPTYQETAVIGDPGSGDYLEINALGNRFITFNTNFLEQARITSTGNLGLGTQNPQTRLHVSVESFLASATAPVAVLEATASGTSGPGLGAELVFRAENASGTTSATASVAGVLASPTGEQGALTFSTSSGPGPLVERMRIDEFGRVGIGTASTTALLRVSGGTTVTGALLSEGPQLQWGKPIHRKRAGAGSTTYTVPVGRAFLLTFVNATTASGTNTIDADLDGGGALPSVNLVTGNGTRDGLGILIPANGTVTITCGAGETGLVRGVEIPAAQAPVINASDFVAVSGILQSFDVPAGKILVLTYTSSTNVTINLSGGASYPSTSGVANFEKPILIGDEGVANEVATGGGSGSFLGYLVPEAQ